VIECSIAAGCIGFLSVTESVELPPDLGSGCMILYLTFIGWLIFNELIVLAMLPRRTDAIEACSESRDG
jgi:hypothetical protein